MSDSKKTRPPNRFTRLMLDTFSTCRRRYFIEYENNYRLKGRRPWPWPPSLKYALHSALRERDFAITREIGRLRVACAGEAILKAYATRLKAAAMVPPADEKKAAKVDELFSAATAIIEHYNEVHERDVTGEGIRFMAGDRPVVDRLHTAQLMTKDAEKTDWLFSERIDGVLHRGELPPAVLVRRLTSSVDPADVERELALDLSIQGMMWCASWLIGEPVLSAVVDVVRTKPPSIPERTNCRTCRGAGTKSGEGDGEEDCSKCGGTGIGGMSRKPCDTTIDIWIRSVSDAKLDLAKEMERCKTTVNRIRGRGESFAYRVIVDSSKEMLRRWNHDALDTVLEIDGARNTGRWPRNPAACVGLSGPCPYRRVCSSPADADVAVFTRHVDPYPGIDA